jgi:hypothetical protein
LLIIYMSLNIILIREKHWKISVLVVHMAHWKQSCNRYDVSKGQLSQRQLTQYPLVLSKLLYTGINLKEDTQHLFNTVHQYQVTCTSSVRQGTHAN